MEAIQLNNRTKIENEVSNFIKALEMMTYNYALLYSIQLIISILKHYSNLSPSKDINLESFYSIMNTLHEIETLDEIMDYLKSLCFDISDKLEKKRTSKNAHIVLNLQEYIKNNYSDPGLCLNTLSERIHLTSNYLGRLFRSYSNMSFGDYVNLVRLEKAKELLVETKIPASEISEQVGFSNTTYFFVQEGIRSKTLAI